MASETIQITDEMRQARADAIADARSQCTVMLSNTPREDRLYVMMNKCYEHNIEVFRPIEYGPPLQPYNDGTPIFHPDPDRR